MVFERQKDHIRTRGPLHLPRSTTVERIASTTRYLKELFFACLQGSNNALRPSRINNKNYIGLSVVLVLFGVSFFQTQRASAQNAAVEELRQLIANTESNVSAVQELIALRNEFRLQRSVGYAFRNELNFLVIGPRQNQNAASTFMPPTPSESEALEEILDDYDRAFAGVQGIYSEKQDSMIKRILGQPFTSADIIYDAWSLDYIHEYHDRFRYRAAAELRGLSRIYTENRKAAIVQGVAIAFAKEIADIAGPGAMDEKAVLGLMKALIGEEKATELDLHSKIGAMPWDKRANAALLANLLGRFVTSGDDELLLNFPHVKPFLQAMGLWQEVITNLRMVALRALGAIRSPYAYYWITKAVGLTDASGRETPVSIEACRILSHDHQYPERWTINGENAAPYFTFEKWLGMKFATDEAQESTNPVVRGQNTVRVDFARRLQLDVFTHRRRQSMSPEGREPEGLKEHALANAMQKILPREHNLASQEKFLSHDLPIMNSLSDINTRIGPSSIPAASIAGRVFESFMDVLGRCSSSLSSKSGSSPVIASP